MFHVIDRPPFDDFTFRLFTELYKNKKSYGLQHAQFIYTWSAYMSQVDGHIKSKTLFVPGYIGNVPEDITEMYFWKFGYNHILGESKYINQVDDLYNHFTETMKNEPNFNEATYDKFCSTYNRIHRSIQNKKQVEYKIQDIIKKTDTVVLFVKDHFRVDLHKSWTIDVPELAEYFSNMCDFYSNKKFVLVTSLENLDKEINKPNCSIITMGGDITNQINRFDEYNPVTTKFKSNKSVISLNRGIRNHRTYLVSLLYGLDLDKHVAVSYLDAHKVKGDALTDVLKYDYVHDNFFNIVSQGFSKFKMSNQVFDDSEIYKNTTSNDNIYNFNNSLTGKYQSSFVEFVTETNYNELGFNVTEKLSHSVFGYNLPILVSSPGYIEFLRQAGFDVFDDIVNHSYDNELDKTIRIQKAVTDNIELVSSNMASDMFIENKTRFDHNCRLLKEDLSKFYTDRFWKNIEKIKP